MGIKRLNCFPFFIFFIKCLLPQFSSLFNRIIHYLQKMSLYDCFDEKFYFEKRNVLLY